MYIPLELHCLPVYHEHDCQRDGRSHSAEVIKHFSCSTQLSENEIYPAHKCYQRTNGPVKAHLISGPTVSPNLTLS